MVAVRDTHLKAGFDLHDWMTTVDLPEADKSTLLSVYEYCHHRIEDQNEQQRLSKRSAEMIGILLTLHMDMDTLKSAVLFPLIEPGYLTVEQIKADFKRQQTTPQIQEDPEKHYGYADAKARDNKGDIAQPQKEEQKNWRAEADAEGGEISGERVDFWFSCQRNQNQHQQEKEDISVFFHKRLNHGYKNTKYNQIFLNYSMNPIQVTRFWQR